MPRVRRLSVQDDVFGSGVVAPCPALADLLALTRPPVILVVVLSGWPAYWLEHGARGALAPLLSVVLGTCLLAAGCSAVNAWWERSRDARMARTRRRPLPAGRLRPHDALAFGALITAAGLGVLAAGAGVASAALGAATFAWYVFAYTAWAKPRTHWSTVVGALAGAAAPLIASAAGAERVGPWGWWLFGVVFLWQLPHVWAIALFRGAEYAAAGVPTLAAAIGESRTRLAVLVSSLPLVALTLVPWLAHRVGPAYVVTALASGGWLVGCGLRAVREPSAVADRRVFRATLLQLVGPQLAMLAELALR